MPAREGSQRPGGEGRREALLARWLQEGNKRLRERLGAGLAPHVRPRAPAQQQLWQGREALRCAPLLLPQLPSALDDGIQLLYTMR